MSKTTAAIDVETAMASDKLESARAAGATRARRDLPN